MSLTGHKTASALLVVLAACLVVALGGLGWQSTYANRDAREAYLASKHMKSMRQRALRSDPRAAAACLQEIASERVHVGWLRPELHFKELVESQRAAAVHDVIQYLQLKTGGNLGETPDKWIERYAGSIRQP